MMSGHLRYDPEHLAVLQVAFGGQTPEPAPPPEDILEFRAGVEQMMYMAYRVEPSPENVTQTPIDIKSHDGCTIQLHHFSTKDATGEKSGAAALYVHGGGMIACSVETYAPLVARYAARTGIAFFAVEYRLAPEQKDDSLVKDTYAALEYISTHAGDFGIDSARLAVMGDSAGGGIAAGTSLMARDKGLKPPLSKQLLIYPMLDDRTTTLAPDSHLAKFLFIWGPSHSKSAWQALLGEKAGREDEDISIYAAPARASDLSNLPDTYVDVGGLDYFTDDCIAFVGRLAKAGIQTEFHLWPGLTHGFDTAPVSATRAAQEARDKFLKSA